MVVNDGIHNYIIKSSTNADTGSTPVIRKDIGVSP
jgi:hypothetical protein